MATATEPTLLTAEEFAQRPDPGYPEELVEGRIEAMSPPRPHHGYVCGEIFDAIRSHVTTHDLGYVLCNDSGVITQRGPDTVRGADVCYYSHARVPKGGLPRDRYLDVPPDLVAEVLSPGDRWPRVLRKVSEYLSAGVTVVIVLDTERRNVQVYEGEGPIRILQGSEAIVLPALFGDGLRIEVSRLFD